MSRTPPQSAPDSGFADLLDAVRGIRWPANFRLRGGNPGLHASRLRGSSAEFMEYRPYRQGDYTGRIDWKLFARSNRAYIRLSNDHAILPTVFILDASASMAFPTSTMGKWQLAASVVTGLASIARNGGDPVGLIIPGPAGDLSLRPGTRQSVLTEMIRAVSDRHPGGSSSLASALSAVSHSAGRVVVITDFLGDTDELISAAGRCVMAGCEVHAVHIVAAEELNPSRESQLVRDPEDDAIRRPLTETAMEMYRAEYSTWREHVARGLADAGVFYTLAVAGDEAAEHVVRKIAAPRTLTAL